MRGHEESSTVTSGPSASRRATSYDVALRAGVSQSAVSRCFRDGASISADKRARIEAAAAALGYAPNKIARSLITQRSRILGVLVTARTTRNVPDLLLKMGQEIQAAGHRMLLFTMKDGEQPIAALPDILAYHLDGVISGVTLPDPMLRICAQRNVPVVLYNREARNNWACSVGCDDPRALSMLAAHLREDGSRRVAFLAGPEESTVAKLRRQAMEAAVREHDLNLVGIKNADFTYEGGRRSTRQLIADLRPDTIVCANDAMALGVMDACRYEMKLQIPRDIAVAGYDDMPESAWPPYDLTTLAQPVDALSRAAVRMIGDQLDGSGPPGERRLMQADLVLRSSTRSKQGGAAVAQAFAGSPGQLG
jgi:DNA-binding LacI/PurR family transcriptional regulator